MLAHCKGQVSHDSLNDWPSLIVNLSLMTVLLGGNGCVDVVFLEASWFSLACQRLNIVNQVEKYLSTLALRLLAPLLFLFPLLRGIDPVDRGGILSVFSLACVVNSGLLGSVGNRLGVFLGRLGLQVVVDDSADGGVPVLDLGVVWGFHVGFCVGPGFWDSL